MTPVGFEPTIPVFERAKTVHALDRAAIVIDGGSFTREKIKQMSIKIKILRKCKFLTSNILIYYLVYGTYHIMRK
jgi:hypothetical protein